MQNPKKKGGSIKPRVNPPDFVEEIKWGIKKVWAKSRSHWLPAPTKLSLHSSIPSLRPEPVSNQSVTMCHTVYLHCAESKFKIMLHPKIAWIRPQRLLSKDLRGLVHGTLHPPERRNGSKWLLKSMSQCEVNCHVKVGFNWNDQSNFQVSDVEFARVWFVGSLGWQKSTAQRLTCSVMLTHDS